MQFVKPRYRRVMQFPVTVKVPLNIVIETGCERVIRILGPNHALPARVVEWMATNPSSPHRDAVELADDDSVPAGRRTVDGTVVINDVEVVNVPDGAQIIFNVDNGLGVSLSAAPVAQNATQSAADALESAAGDEGANIPANMETPASAAPTKPEGQPKREPFGLSEAAIENIAETGAKLYETLKSAQAKPAPAKPQAAKGKPAPTKKKK